MTMAGARMLGLDSRIGSLEAGKDADFIVLSGDPLSVYTHVEQTWVEGAKVFDRSNPEDRKVATGGYGALRDEAMDLDGDEGGTMTVPSAECQVPCVLSCPVLACRVPRAGAMCLVLCAAPASAQVAVRGETVHTMAGAPIKDGVVLVGKDGKIERVGPAASVRIPDGLQAAAREGRHAGAGRRALGRRAGRLSEPAARPDAAGDLVGDPARAARHRRLQRARDAGGVAAHSRRHHDPHRARARGAGAGPDDGRQDARRRSGAVGDRAAGDGGGDARRRAAWPGRASRPATGRRPSRCCAPS